MINMTQHETSPEQLAAGVFARQDGELISKLLTFEEPPTLDEIWDRIGLVGELVSRQANQHIARTGNEVFAVMIGGAPFFMAPLEKELVARGFQPHYAFSKRVSVEVDGKKTSVFKHTGFVLAESAH